MIAAGIDLGRARSVRNDDHASGQASSLRAGLRAMASAAATTGPVVLDAVVVLLGDQPMVSAALLEALVARQRETGAAAVLCLQDGQRSPPTLLHRDLWADLEALRGDTGAREILARRSDVALLPVEHEVAGLGDVDTPEDLRRLDAAGRIDGPRAEDPLKARPLDA